MFAAICVITCDIGFWYTGIAAESQKKAFRHLRNLIRSGDVKMTPYKGNKEKIKEETETDNVVPFLRLLPGGKGPDDPRWLFTLPVGTVFLTRPRGYDKFFLDQYHVANIDGDAVLLLSNLNGHEYIPVDGKMFSKQMELFKIVSLGDE